MAEFKFRAGDRRPSFTPPLPPPALQYVPPRPPAVYCLSKPGFPDACCRRSTNIVTLRNSVESNEEMYLEMELMRLREEKLLAEIERQRFLKEEAMRELVFFEREVAIREVAQSAGYPQRLKPPSRAAAVPSPPSCTLPSTPPPLRWIVPFSPELPPSLAPLPSPSTAAVVVQSFHEWQKMERVKSSDRLGFGAVAWPPPPLPIQPLVAEDKKEPRVEGDEREQLIVLEKPDPNAFREKRKAETTPPPTNVIQPSVAKKKKISKEELSCALCEVSVSSERVFNEHLQGKKHLRKVASLRAEKESKRFQAVHETLLNNKRRKLCKPIATAGAEGEESKDGEKVLLGEKTEGSVEMKGLIPNFLKSGYKDNNKLHKAIAAAGGAKGKESKDGEKIILGEKTEGSIEMKGLIPNFLKSGDKDDNNKLRKAIAAAGAEGKESKDGEKTLLGEKTEGSVEMNGLIPNFLKSGDKYDNNKLPKAIAAAGAEGKESKDGEKTLLGEKTDGSVEMNRLIPNFLTSGDKDDNNKQQKTQIVFRQNPITNDEMLAKKQFTFWCEKCKVGAYSTEVILAHVNGKKHRTNL